VSAIIGIFDRKGAAVERSLVRDLTQFLAYCGPDWRDVWAEGPIGFGHAMLRTTREAIAERQPLSLDGEFWITADARLDGREELRAALEKAERRVTKDATDPELILHAYAAWNSDCVRHLRGDFAFAIWDRRRESLFCVRDHFGVKPFYYADLDGQFVFSTVQDCVRLHPDVSHQLNETAIGDFLLFGMNGEMATTPFRDVQRLAPSHTLLISREEFLLRRYWTPPVDGRIRYRHAHEYVEHFQVLLEAAVNDRLRTDAVGILLSGGLDSGAIASVARTLSKKSAPPIDLRAYTVVYESLIPDTDGPYANETAEFLKIPSQRLALDHLQPFDSWDRRDWTWPEPAEDPFFAGLLDQFELISQDCRVALFGEGCDNLMHFEMWPHAKDLAGRRQWAQLLNEMRQYASRRPSPWASVQRRIRNLFDKELKKQVFPPWIAPDFAHRLRLDERWKDGLAGSPSERHPILPRGHASLSAPGWTYLFEHQNPGVTRRPVEVRYPFLDLRIVEYLLAIPPFPWFFEKALLREAMVVRLPESVRRRPKTPLAVDPLRAWLKREESCWPTDVQWSEEMSRYIDLRVLGARGGKKRGELPLTSRAYSLNFWLQSVRRVRYNLRAEARNG
jgi:asparagine synthase (glutamine-hydrolysing)